MLWSQHVSPTGCRELASSCLAAVRMWHKALAMTCVPGHAKKQPQWHLCLLMCCIHPIRPESKARHTCTPCPSAYVPGTRRTSGAAHAKVKALLLDRCVLDRMLAKPTSCIVRGQGCDSIS